MPSSSAAQHRWIGWLHSDPEAQKQSGMSKAKVDEWLHADEGSPWEHRDDGGGITTGSQSGQGLGGISPSAQSMNPIVANAIQRYAGLPTEQLAELASRLGPGSQQGQMVQRILQQKRMMPQGAQQAQQQPQAQGAQVPQGLQTPPIGQQPQPLRRGGAMVRRVEGGNIPYGDPRWMPRYSVNDLRGGGLHTAIQALQSDDDQKDLVDSLNYHGYHVPQVLRARGGGMKRASGGDMGVSPSMASPWWTRAEARGSDSGFLHGSTPGRADSVLTTAPGGAYVLPADVVSGLGEGNSLAGARIAQAIFSTGPGGIPLPRGGGGRGPPRAPAEFREEAKSGGSIKLFKGGGGTKKGTPVALSHGEFVVSPEYSLWLGNGDIKRGHALLDKWVLEQRKKQIAKTKALPPPVKS